jgi:8-oxo-dGTP pyrophosphatase MutT (NUDIX family)
MLHAAALETLRAALEADPGPVPAPGDRLAAVLVPIVLAPEPSLVFTVRAAALSRHAGEISFPGGLQDPGEILAETALREAHEEIGLDPALPRLLGALPPVHTFVSRILVVPFVGTLDRLPVFTVNEGEIDEVLTFGIARMAAIEREVTYDRPGGRVWRGFAYELDGHTVWGATGSMVHALLDRIRLEGNVEIATMEETTWPRP